MPLKGAIDRSASIHSHAYICSVSQLIHALPFTPQPGEADGKHLSQVTAAPSDSAVSTYICRSEAFSKLGFVCKHACSPSSVLAFQNLARLQLVQESQYLCRVASLSRTAYYSSTIAGVSWVNHGILIAVGHRLSFRSLYLLD